MDRTSTSLSGAIELTRLILPALSSVLSPLQIIKWINRIFGIPSDTLKLSAVYPLIRKGIGSPIPSVILFRGGTISRALVPRILVLTPPIYPRLLFILGYLYIFALLNVLGGYYLLPPLYSLYLSRFYA